eukprot:g33247.t1
MALFSLDPPSEDACRVLWEDLPQVSLEDAGRLDAPVTLEELTGTLTQLLRDKTLGLDWLIIALFRAFWDILGECPSGGELPLSWRRAIIVFLPKKGDIPSFKNWCQVSFLSTDYKIFTRVLFSQLSSMVGDIFHPDQSYMVQGWWIHDNVHLVQDLIHFCQLTGLLSAFLSLEQEKAFDRVDHEYLFGTLRALRHLGPKTHLHINYDTQLLFIDRKGLQVVLKERLGHGRLTPSLTTVRNTSYCRRAVAQ